MFIFSIGIFICSEKLISNEDSVVKHYFPIFRTLVNPGLLMFQYTCVLLIFAAVRVMVYLAFFLNESRAHLHNHTLSRVNCERSGGYDEGFRIPNKEIAYIGGASLGNLRLYGWTSDPIVGSKSKLYIFMKYKIMELKMESKWHKLQKSIQNLGKTGSGENNVNTIM